MCIKKTYVKVALIGIISLVTIIIYNTFATVTIKVKIPENEILSLTYNSSIIEQKDYERVISKIEGLRFYRCVADPETREMDLYVVVEDVKGDIEIIACNDNLFTHSYNNIIIETYKIPLITQIYIRCYKETK